MVCSSRGTTKVTGPDWADNIYRTAHNPDRTTNVHGFNSKTGSTWDENYYPALGVQSGHRKNGAEFTGSLVPPFGSGASEDPQFIPDDSINVIFKPSEHDIWLKNRRGHPFDGPFGLFRPQRDDVNNDTDEQQLSDAAQEQLRALAAREEQDRAIRGVLRQMKPSAIVNAAREAAQQRCQKLSGQKAIAESINGVTQR